VEFRLQVALEMDESMEESAPWAAALSQELAELDCGAIEQMYEASPDGAKGFAPGLLLALVPAATVTTLFDLVRSWVVRTGRTVEVSIDGDTIKITGASEQQQDRVVEAWLARHAAGS